MALNGLHVACAYVDVYDGAALLGEVLWSETLPSAGTTTNTAPEFPGTYLPSATILRFVNMELRPSTDAWVAIGTAPDATNGPRIFVGAGECRNVKVSKGARVAWIAA